MPCHAEPLLTLHSAALAANIFKSRMLFQRNSFTLPERYGFFTIKAVVGLAVPIPLEHVKLSILKC